MTILKTEEKNPVVSEIQNYYFDWFSILILVYRWKIVYLSSHSKNLRTYMYNFSTGKSIFYSFSYISLN